MAVASKPAGGILAALRSREAVGIASLLAVWCVIRRLLRKSMPKFREVPGTWFLGVLNQLGPNAKDYTKKMDEWAAQYGQEGVFEITLVGQRQAVICDWALAQKVLSMRPAKMLKPSEYDHIGMPEGAGIFFSQGEQWKRERRLMAPAFNKRNVDSYAPAVEAKVEQLLQLLAADTKDGGKANVSQRLVRFTSDVIMQVASGQDHRIQLDADSPVPRDTQLMIDGLMSRFLSPLPYWKLPLIGDLDGMNGAMKRLSKTFTGLLDTTGSNTILEKLRQAEGEKLSPQELAGNIRVLLVAGTDTTSKALSWALYFLAKDQELQARAAKEAAKLGKGDLLPEQLDGCPLVQAIWNETLRRKGPAPFDQFENAAPVELAGRTLPPGCQILVLYRYILHTAPAIKAALGEDMDVFRPDRWLAKDGSVIKVPELDALAFGHGQRICLGMRLADFEGRLVLCRLLQRFEIQPWDGPELQERTSFVLEPAEDVKVALKPRS